MGLSLVLHTKNLSDSNLWKLLYNGFSGNGCRKCFTEVSVTKDTSNPQPIPYIGPDFGKDPFGLFFCGIETYCNDTRNQCPNDVYDIFPTSQVESLYFEKEPKVNNYSPFWKWVRTISENLLKPEFENPFRHIAYSNLIKCQSRSKGKNFRDSKYELSSEIATNCIRNCGWIYREIRQIGAKNIIVFSGIQDDFYLARLFLNDEKEGKMITKFDYNSVNSRESMRKERKDKDLFVHLRDGEKRFIITNHPQGTPHEIRDKIVQIIRDNDWTCSDGWRMP